jgi:nucleoside-diphosphate-sugar epimerase
MKILIVGANGLLGSGAVAALTEGNEIIQASRTGDVSVDLTNPESIAAMYAKVGKVDAVISATGKVPFKTLSELTLLITNPESMTKSWAKLNWFVKDLSTLTMVVRSL